MSVGLSDFSRDPVRTPDEPALAVFACESAFNPVVL